MRLLALVCLLGQLCGCGDAPRNECTAENHCRIQDGVATCDDGYTWRAPGVECVLQSPCDTCRDVVDENPALPGSQITERLGGQDRLGGEYEPTPVALPLTAVVTLTDDAEAADCVSFDVAVESQLVIYTGDNRWSGHWFSGLTACTSPQDPAVRVEALSPTPLDINRFDTSNPGADGERCETSLVVVPAGKNMVCVERHDAASVVKELEFGILSPVPLSEPLHAADQPGPRNAPSRVLPFTEPVAFDGRLDLDCFSTTAPGAGLVTADVCGQTGLYARVVGSDNAVMSREFDETFKNIDCGGSLGAGSGASLKVVSGQTVLVCAQAAPQRVEGDAGELRARFIPGP